MTHPGYLTTRKFAWAVDEPVSTILQKHRSGEFPAAVAGGLGRGRRSLYSPEQIEAYRLRKIAEREASSSASLPSIEPRDEVLSIFEAWCRLLPLERVRQILRGISGEKV